MSQSPESVGKRVRARVRRYLFEDARLKLLALLIVTVIWFSVAGQTRTGTPVKIPGLAVTLDNVPTGLAVTSSDPTQVTITVSGPEDQVRELRLGAVTQSIDVTAFADLSSLMEGVQFARLGVRGLPDGVTLEKIEPAESVRVTLDPIRAKDVPVEPVFAGTLPEGYKLTGAYTDPATVTITGPESVIGKIEKVTTTTVSLNNRLSSFAESVDVDLAGADVEVQTALTLHVTIEEDFGSRSFTVPVSVAPGAGGEPESQTLLVTLKGPIPALVAIKPSDISATVTPTGSAARQTLVPKVNLLIQDPSRVEIDRIVPASVRWHK